VATLFQCPSPGGKSGSSTARHWTDLLTACSTTSCETVLPLRRSLPSTGSTECCSRKETHAPKLAACLKKYWCFLPSKIIPNQQPSPDRTSNDIFSPRCPFFLTTPCDVRYNVAMQPPNPRDIYRSKTDPQKKKKRKENDSDSNNGN